MERAKTPYAMLALMLATSMPSHAQSVGELSRIQAETLIIRANAAKAEAQAELDAARAKSAANGGSHGNEEVGLPNVKGVYGSGRLIANLLFADGSTMEVTEGDHIRGGFVVRTVSVDKVVLGRQGKVFPLGFSQKMPISPSDRPMQSASAMSPMPAPFLPAMPTPANTKGAP